MELLFLNKYLVLSSIVFVIGILGIICNRRSVLHIFMALELMLLAVSINFVAFAAYLQDVLGQIFTMFILTVAAAEIAIGLAILVTYKRNRGSISVEDIDAMGG